MNYTEDLLILISTITGCGFISVFASLAVILTSSVAGLKVCVITTGIKTYISIIKKKNKKHDKILSKSKLNCLEVLISKALIDSNIIHDEFVLINNVSKEFYDIKKEIKNSNDL